MSSRNGDKSRFRINQERKLLKRVRLRALLATLQPNAAPAETSSSSRRRP